MPAGATTLRLLCGLLFGTVGCLYLVYEREFSATTWTTLIDERVSPDAKWRAVVEESVYEANFVTYVVASVRLISTKEPTLAADILGIDTAGHADQRPRIAWTGPEVLQVTVPNLSFLNTLHRTFDGARIDLRFDPDDPPARAAWLRRVGLPAETVPGH